MKWHPLARRFEAITGPAWEEFKAGIRATKGVHTQPILYRVVKGEEQGLDGLQRWTACRELKLPCRRKRVRVRDKDVAAFILSHNINRRHMTPEIRAELAAELKAAGQSNRRIASALNVSESTVRADLEGAQNRAPETVIGADGKSYPATQAYTPKPKAFDWGPLLGHCDKALSLIDDCADYHGIEAHDEEIEEIKGIFVEAKIRLAGLRESLS